MRRTLLALLTITLAALTVPRTRSHAQGALPLVFHVVTDADGRAVADAPFLTEALARANTIYAPYGIAFRDAGRSALPARHALLTSRADRDALLPYVRRGAIHCMVVATLMDVDEPGRERRGVHWYTRGAPRPHAVLLSARAEPRVLAHELGHYLGLPEHRQVPGNVMSYLWGDGVPSFDPDQVTRITRTVARMRARGELGD
jgi:hypothetical protein